MFKDKRKRLRPWDVHKHITVFTLLWKHKKLFRVEEKKNLTMSWELLDLKNVWNVVSASWWLISLSPDRTKVSGPGPEPRAFEHDICMFSVYSTVQKDAC